jgi:hypothetical protein
MVPGALSARVLTCPAPAPPHRGRAGRREHRVHRGAGSLTALRSGPKGRTLVGTVSRPGGRGVARPRRGRSGLRRTGCWCEPGRGDLSVQGNREQTADGPGNRAQARVKRCGKSAPASGATPAARQPPPGARSNAGGPVRPISPGRPHRWMATPEARAEGQNPAYKPAHRHRLAGAWARWPQQRPAWPAPESGPTNRVSDRAGTHPSLRARTRSPEASSTACRAQEA